MQNLRQPIKNDKIKSLQFVVPSLYRYLCEFLEREFHIHSYDYDVFAEIDDEKIHVIFQFGHYSLCQVESSFSINVIVEPESTFRDFLKEIGHECRQVLINDYFKKMTP